MAAVTAKSLVLLTGVNGFVGAHVLNGLLQANYRVRGVVRSLSKAEYLIKQHPDHIQDMTFIEVPDIQAPHALDEAVKDCQYICHVASPYFLQSSNPIKELVEPAINGTRNVMSSALQSPTLKRLTIMSSFAAVVDLSKNPRGGYTYTSADWDPLTFEEAAQNGSLGYHYSKTAAERTAWEIFHDARPAWDMVTFNPPMVYGPPIQELDPTKGLDGLNTSTWRLIYSITGRDPSFAPRVATPNLPAWADVRDVAAAHVRSLSLAPGISQRFLLCNGIDYFEDGLASGLRKREDDNRIKALAEPGKRINRADHFAIDSSTARAMLGIEFRPFQRTVEDVWDRLAELGYRF